MIWPSAVSAPTLVASKRSAPLWLIEPPTTSSPGPFSTGTDSPVTRLSSIAEWPSRTTPSTGTLSPGLSTTVSPTPISLLGTSISWPSRITVAFGGTMSNRALSESVVPRRAFISIQCPKRTKVTKSTAASKKVSPPITVIRTLNDQAARTPTAIRTLMFRARERSEV